MKRTVSVIIRAYRFYTFGTCIVSDNSILLLIGILILGCFSKQTKQSTFINWIAGLTVANRISTIVMLQAGRSHFELSGNVFVAVQPCLQCIAFCEPLTPLRGHSVI